VGELFIIAVNLSRPSPTTLRSLPVKYKWILFDADETLFHFDAYKGLKLMFSRLGVAFSDEQYHAFEAVNLPLWQQYQDGEISAKQLRHHRFAYWADKLATTTEHLNEAFLAAMAEICTLLPGVQSLIEKIEGKAHLGIITNGFTELQQVRLEKTGLDSAFTTLVISEQVGVAKPDPAIFEHALEQMNFPPKEQVLMVGDNPHSDIVGGLKAGLHTCWLNLHGSQRPQGVEPHYEIRCMDELHDILLASA